MKPFRGPDPRPEKGKKKKGAWKAPALKPKGKK